jgi:hypothetical protein
MYEGSLGEHGLPTWIAQDPHRKFVIDEIEDEAQAVLDAARKDNLNPGVQLRIVDAGPLDDE